MVHERSNAVTSVQNRVDLAAALLATLSLLHPNSNILALHALFYLTDVSHAWLRTG